MLSRNAYQKPKITQKKIKISFFLSNIAWLDQFNLTGDIYAQSGGADCGCTNSDIGGGCNSGPCGGCGTPEGGCSGGGQCGGRGDCTGTCGTCSGAGCEFDCS